MGLVLKRLSTPLALCPPQINYSLLYRKQGAQVTADFCRDHGIAVLGYFPLGNGLLAGKYGPDSLPPGFKGRLMRKYVVGGVTEKGVAYPAGGASPLINAMRAIGTQRGKSVAQVAPAPFASLGLRTDAQCTRAPHPPTMQVALNYVMCKGVIPIPGCRNAAQAADNAAALGWKLDEGELQGLESVAEKLGFEFSGGGFGLVED